MKYRQRRLLSMQSRIVKKIKYYLKSDDSQMKSHLVKLLTSTEKPSAETTRPECG